uniref:Vacuolar protein sorting 13 homolog A n=1 Tax=Chrysemys picta bellii TaxID=8478 RepID=A0A8C3I6F1_CHRPI
MVFESLVVDVLNRFLGDYVVNLDSSQLSLGIWGGNENPAASQLDVPFKVKAGHIGQLNLQIPWKYLYTQPVEAVLDGVYLLIVPTASIKYDAEKEDRQLLEAKQRELQRIEDAKQKIADQVKIYLNTLCFNLDKGQEEKQDTFVEKLVTQVIKNLQVKISNIHIRYEDDCMSVEHLAILISMRNLKIMGSTERYHSAFDFISILFYLQLVRLDNLFAYWNVKSVMFYHGGYDESLVSQKLHSVSIFRPISAKAKLRMNPRSDFDFSSPKMDLDVNLQDIAIEFNKPQYFSIMELLESIDMMTRNLPYRKYRPDVLLHNNAKMWWKYIIKGILEVNVQPKLNMWSWEHIRHHRKQVKNYKEMYKMKITSKKPSEEIVKLLEVSNFQFDIEHPNLKTTAFFFLGNAYCKYDECFYNVAGLEELMTLEEKAKLYAAIGYSETAVDPTLPKTYEAMKLSVKLLSMSISIRENKEKPELIKFAVIDLSTMLIQRPGAQAIRFETKISTFEVTGMSQEKFIPCLLSSRTVHSENNTSLLSIMFETNPLDEKADQKLRIESQPLEIIYDARTVNSLVDFFRPPKDVHLEQLTSATLMKLEEFREKTSTGLLYVIETQKVLNLKINLMASYVLVPQNGFYESTSNLLLLDLGNLQVHRSDVSELKVGQSTIEDIMSRAYDSFDIQLSSIQLLYCKHHENWKEARKLKYSSQHILRPMDVKVEFSRAMVVTDARMPKFKIFGQLPLLSVQISDQKLMGILELIDSIPKPESGPATMSAPKPAQALYITGKEVFSFKMMSYVDATDGAAYTNMNIVDSQVYLTVGCIQVVFVNKFVSTILAFINNFQAAKEAITEATVQAAEKAATGVKELAQRSSRMALDINIKAPVIIVPQSADSTNVLVADFGLITVKNQFSVKTKAQCSLPPVIDSMTVKLSELKLYRAHFERGSLQSEIQLLQPLNLEVIVERNLAAAWYSEVPDIKILGRLKPMNVSVQYWKLLKNICGKLMNFTPFLKIIFKLILSQEDLTTILRTLNENLGDSSGVPPPLPEPKDTSSNCSDALSTSQKSAGMLFKLKQQSRSIIWYYQVNSSSGFTRIDDHLKLAEFKLVLISAAAKMLSDGSMNASVKLANCTLDDKRLTVQKTTPRMVEMKHGSEKKDMVDVSYKQGRDGTVLDTIVQDVYLCASMEFLLTVADIFLKASAESAAAQRNIKQTLAVKEQASMQPVSSMEMNIIVKNPEIVFVADLTRSDAPALVVTTQCEIFIKNSPQMYKMTAAVKDIQMKACPFLAEKRKGNITTVLQPCDFFFKMVQSGNNPQMADLSIKSLTIKVSPIIINTVITITSALSPTTETSEEEISPIPPDLWDKKDIKKLKMWFLEKSNENENKNTAAELVLTGETLNMRIESVIVTLEAGVGHRTVPMLLAKSSFSGEVKNWTLESDAEEEHYKVPEYKTVINISSKDQLNITLSKCGLQMLSNLGMAFAEAASKTSDIFKKDQAPFVIMNSLGLPITVSPSDSFKVLNVESGAKTFHLKDGESLNMEFLRTKSESDQFTLSIFAKQLLMIYSVGRCLYRVRHEESGVERSIVCQIDTVEGSKMITIRSPVQIRNHFSIPLSLFEDGTCLGTASPINEFNIPLTSYRSLLCLQPVTDENGIGGEYEMCEGISFDEIMKNFGNLIQRKCQSVKSTNHSLIINVVPVKDTLTSSVCADDRWDLPYVIHLWPSVLLRNLLPYPITYSLEIHNAVLDQTKLELQLLNYLDQNWKSEYHIRTNQQEIGFITFSCITEVDKTELDIAVHVTYTTGQMIIAIHSPYWMVNKTGRMLQYKADGIHRKHPPDYKKPLLFSFQPKNFFQNNKVQLMVTDSELSDQFSLDTVGSHGSVKCKSHKKEYHVGVTIDNSSFNITRIVTFTPFFMVANRSKYTLEVAEEGKEKWIPITFHLAQSPSRWSPCIPFWPENDSNKLLIRVENSNIPPKMICFNKQENCTLLYLDNKLGGIIVDVNLTEHSTVITLSDYHDGAAPFLLINHTKEEMIEYGQSSLNVMEDHLMPNKAVLYTWADPVGSRKLKWKCGKCNGEVTQKDVCVLFNIIELLLVVYLVSFFEGLQRIILFTEDESVFKATYESEKVELAEQEIVLSLQDVGISLVNNYTKQEVSYIGITSSDVVWETKPKKKSRWRPMSIKQTEKLERAFKEYSELSPSENKIVELETNVMVIFVCLTPNGGNMKIQQPNEIPVRRNYLPALNVEYSTSAHQKSFRVQVYWIQIQNQIPGAIFPFVFYPIKPPKSITLDSESVQKELMSMSSTDTSQISLYEYFHISPIKLHLSFSLSTGGEDSNKEERQHELIPVQSVNLLLKSIGATLTDVQDVVFKLAFFELRYHFCTTQQLQSAVIKHYSKQAIKQMYVLILGLDVLGNPFGFIRDLSEGVEAFFYEPYQGAIQGPEEFVEGMALGLKALVGGAVGGLAGAASRITSAMAKGVAAITMDEDYQQKRRETMNKQPSGLREGITRGGKGLGFVSGITGIVTKPIRGAQKEGAAGFFKGVGKGLVGAVARPTGGIIDMASSTFQGIKRATDSSDDVTSLRPPRFFCEDGVIRPYRLRDGTGSQMLQVNLSKKIDSSVLFQHHHCYNCPRKVSLKKIIKIHVIILIFHSSFHFQVNWFLNIHFSLNMLNFSVKCGSS